MWALIPEARDLRDSRTFIKHALRLEISQSPTPWRALLSVLNFQLARIQRRPQDELPECVRLGKPVSDRREQHSLIIVSTQNYSPKVYV